MSESKYSVVVDLDTTDAVKQLTELKQLLEDIQAVTASQHVHCFKPIGVSNIFCESCGEVRSVYAFQQYIWPYSAPYSPPPYKVTWTGGGSSYLPQTINKVGD